MNQVSQSTLRRLLILAAVWALLSILPHRNPTTAILTPPTPTSNLTLRTALTLKPLTRPQRDAVIALLSSILGEAGLNKVQQDLQGGDASKSHDGNPPAPSEPPPASLLRA